MKKVKIPYGRWKLYGYNVIQIAIDGHSYYGLMMDRTGYIKGYMVIMDKYRDKAKAIIKEVERLNAKKSKLRETKENADNANTISNDKGEAPDSK